MIFIIEFNGIFIIKNSFGLIKYNTMIPEIR